MNRFKAFWTCVFFLVGIFACINSVWVTMEFIEFGHQMPSASDTVIGLVLTVSVFKNLGIRISDGQGGWIG